MKALRCKQFGPPETLVYEEVDTPAVGVDQVLIDMRAAAVNFPDSLIIEDKYQLKPELPFSPGGELAGTVAAVGENVTHVKPGDDVIAFTGYGAFAAQVVARADQVMPKPTGLDYVTASACVMTYGTSYHALVDRAGLLSGETLLVLGASGGVGLAAIEIGKALGAHVIAAASSEAKLAICREHGADETIDYTQTDLKNSLKELTGGAGVDVVYDPVGGAATEAALRGTAWRGRLLVIGFASGDIPKPPLNLALLKGASIIGVFWGSFVQREPEANERQLQTVFKWIRDGRLRPHIGGVYPLARGGEAIAALANRQVSGKLVITNGAD
ncbi:NADPH:quinone oxidoreductase family protein [Salinisphaera hydrothermalis]|uniref:Zinc-containing alcohol dehydrogenase superfamily protein n=1 Tax=Salinisphaera hydrothermalis (strain C41B8) TaxID=1304275 RepID=A0A084ILS5_SALHC|nr:NADPH:quinone oxidoreductase family protein [Salinisphaera hydrothermalis]KEZ77659.1 zinc-containing alcohol dehydrogenase superfamily protein [Salinisphaera hydrothermalis C41B8]